MFSPLIDVDKAHVCFPIILAQTHAIRRGTVLVNLQGKILEGSHLACVLYAPSRLHISFPPSSPPPSFFLSHFTEPLYLVILQNSSEDEADEQPVETITYDDPKSRIERERIIAQLSNCSPNPPTNSECSEGGDDTIDENQVRITNITYLKTTRWAALLFIFHWTTHTVKCHFRRSRQI